MRWLVARRVSACWLLVPSLAWSAGLHAPLGLRWNDPNALAATSADEFSNRLSERIGRTAFDSAATSRALSVTWLGTPEQCRVELSLVKNGEVEGTRQLESPHGDCPSLVPALLTVSALLMEAQEPETAPTSTVDSSVPPPPPPPPPPVSTAEPASEPPRSAPLLISLGADVSSGFAPKLELGPAVALFWAPWPAVRVGVEGALFLRHQYGNGPGFSLRHDRAALLTCGMPLHGSFALGLCGTAALHVYAAEGVSVASSEEHEGVSPSLGAGLRAEWRLSTRLWWVGHVGADMPVHPLYFYYSTAPGGSVTLFRQSQAMPVLFLGLTLEAP